jgi:hypothetical protein
VNRLLNRLHVFILKIAAALALLMLVIDAMVLAAPEAWQEAVQA